MLTVEKCLALLGDKACQKEAYLIRPVLELATAIYEGMADLATLKDVRLPLWNDIALFKEIHKKNANNGPYVSLDTAVRHYIANPHLADDKFESIARTLQNGEPIRTSVLLVKEGHTLHSVDGLHRKIAYLKVFYLKTEGELTPMRCVYTDVPDGTMKNKVLRLNVLGKQN
jgi:hypothetical protein